MLENDLLINLKDYPTIYFLIKTENRRLVINLELERVWMDQDDLSFRGNSFIEIIKLILKMKYPKII